MHNIILLLLQVMTKQKELIVHQLHVVHMYSTVFLLVATSSGGELIIILIITFQTT